MKNKIKKPKNKINFSIIFMSLAITCSNFNSCIAKTIAKNFQKVIPIGKTVGLELNLKSPIVVNVSNVVNKNGEKHSPAKQAGIKNGDKILKINDQIITKTEDVLNAVEKENGTEIEIEILRNKKTIKTKIIPILSKIDEKYKLGIWLNDTVSGIGTITFYDPINEKFASLGHAIVDNNFGSTIDINNGSVHKTEIKQIKKSLNGKAGELVGYFLKEKKGYLSKNCNFGIFGSIEKNFLNDCETDLNKIIEIAPREEIHIGEAYILSNISENKIEKFNIKIEKVIKQKQKAPKGLILKITDKNLIEKTGGIVQGMSGSPIIQDGKLVGAVTHVIINDPIRGYGIFAEWMLEELKEA
ncbi:MAG: SpoIVB peptidase [Clostridiales bacterium]|jgi:stage IV sporulation protein B|nr:SpoIVB peptidase [Clostridiales bacterium]